MKKLKRSLCLVLVLAFTVGLFAAGVPASATVFTDDSKITYKEAVEVLTGIGVLAGFEDGSFAPTDKVTREQAVKIIAYLILGETAANNLVEGENYTDVPTGRWSNPVIHWGTVNGILVGYGNGMFGPEDPVTIMQFAKMLLVALGYGEYDEFNYTEWAINTATLATQNGFFNGHVDYTTLLELDYNNGADREECALMAFNAMFAPYVRGIAKTQEVSAQDINSKYERIQMSITSEATRKVIAALGNRIQDSWTPIIAELLIVVGDLNSYYDCIGARIYGYNPVLPWMPLKTNGAGRTGATSFTDIGTKMDLFGGSVNQNIDLPCGMDEYARPTIKWTYNKDIISETMLEPQAEYTEEVKGKEIYADLLEAGVTDGQIRSTQVGSTENSATFTACTDGDVTHALCEWRGPGNCFEAGDINKNSNEVGNSGNGVLTQVFYFVDMWGQSSMTITHINTYLGQVSDVNEKDGEIDVDVFVAGMGDLQHSGYQLYQNITKGPSGETSSFLQFEVWDIIDSYEATGFEEDDVVTYQYSFMPKTYLDMWGALKYVASKQPGYNGPSIDAWTWDEFELTSVELAEYVEDEFGTYYSKNATKYNEIVPDYVYIGDTRYVYNPMWVVEAHGYDHIFSGDGAKGDEVITYFDRYGNVLAIDGSRIARNYAVVLNKWEDNNANYHVELLFIEGNDQGETKEIVNIDPLSYNTVTSLNDYLYNGDDDDLIDGNIATFPSIVYVRDYAPNVWGNTTRLTVLDNVGRSGVDIDYDKTGDSDIQISSAMNETNIRWLKDTTIFVKWNTKDGGKWEVTVGKDNMKPFSYKNATYNAYMNYNTQFAHVIWLIGGVADWDPTEHTYWTGTGVDDPTVSGIPFPGWHGFFEIEPFNAYNGKTQTSDGTPAANDWTDANNLGWPGNWPINDNPKLWPTISTGTNTVKPTDWMYGDWDFDSTFDTNRYWKNNDFIPISFDDIMASFTP